MAGVSERLDTFFRVGPADLAKPECFAVKRGHTEVRQDVWFNHPRYSWLNTRLDSAPFPTPSLDSVLFSIAGGATPARGDASLYADSGVKFLRILNVGDGEVSDSDLKYISDDVHENDLARSQLAADDVLMTITGRVGSTAVVRKDHLPANINQHIARLRVDTARCRPTFLSEWLNCAAGQKLSNRFVSGGTRDALDYGAIRKIRVALPESLREQDRFLATMDAARVEYKAKLAKADALLAGLDNFVLKALGIEIPPVDYQRVFAVRRGDTARRDLGPTTYAPGLQKVLKSIAAHSAASHPLRAYVDINPEVDVSGLGAQEPVGFLPMASVSDGATGEYTLATRPLAEVRKGYTPFSNGDILWAKITPCMQNGKSCLVNKLPNGIGFGSTEFHVLRVLSADVLPEFVKEFVSQQTIRRAATYTFTGSAGQQRVPAAFLANLPFPLIPEAEQQEIVDSIATARAHARRLRTEAETGWREAKQWFEEQLLGPAGP